MKTLDNISCDIQPVADSHLANKAYVDAAVAAGAGTASVSGENVVSIPAHSLISCEIEPTDDAHLVNKGYVDAVVAAGGGGGAAPVEEPAALGRVVVVDTLSDAASHTGTSLRDAIAAVTDKGSVVIKFAVSGTITLELGEIVIPVGDITIDGEDKITISGGGVSRVFVVSGASGVFRLHRLIVTQGNGVGSAQSKVYGGAILVTGNSTLTARGVTFTENSVSGTGSDCGGGAVCITSSAGACTFIDCVFSNNHFVTTGSKGTGGAVRGTSTSMVHCHNCQFANNYANGSAFSYGGAVECLRGIFSGCSFSGNYIPSGTSASGGAVTITGGYAVFSRCEFSQNYMGGTGSNCTGGAISMINGNISLRVLDCVFTGNSAYYGGAIAVMGSSTVQRHVCIRRCSFDNNAVSNGRGAALYFYYQSALVEDCEIKNHSLGSASGLIYVYGYTGKLFVVTINRCKFTGNSSSAATTGLVYCANLAQVYLYNTVFTANSFTATSGNHKCVYTTGANTWAYIYNCTFTNNDNKGGAFYAAAGGVDIYNSVEVGNGSASGKGTNAAVNAAKFLSDQSASVGRDIAYDATKPLFGADGFTPAAGSQVIDKGDDAYAVTVFDLVGKERVSGTKVDLGAVEFQAS